MDCSHISSKQWTLRDRIPTPSRRGYQQNNKDTMLSYGQQAMDTETVEYFIQQSADINKARNDGCTALILAANKGHLET